jgi:hypothetical protein
MLLGMCYLTADDEKNSGGSQLLMMHGFSEVFVPPMVETLGVRDFWKDAIVLAVNE